MKVRPVVLVGALLLPAGAARAQQSEPVQVQRQVDVMVVHGSDQAGVPLLPPLGAGADFDFVTMPLALGGETVSGAPYSAEAVTETVQSLADGNRITRQSHASVYRDSAGRTRREQGMAVIGNAVNDVGEHRQVQIQDPQAGTVYMLDVENHEARRLPSPKLMVTQLPAPPGVSGGSVTTSSTSTSTSSSSSSWTFEQAVPPPPAGQAGDNAIFIRRGVRTTRDSGEVESLGTQVIEGVQAEGTRSTQTIPAGQIGNDLPIKIVSERWFAPDLKVLVMSRLSDPRFGETTYRLTNITRAEPAPDLFRVPSDFKIVDTPASGGRVIGFEKK